MKRFLLLIGVVSLLSGCYLPYDNERVISGGGRHGHDGGDRGRGDHEGGGERRDRHGD